MRLHLQFGYGMMEHCRSLISSWGGGTAILSPRDLDDDQLKRLSQSINELPGGKCLLDPQFYLPHSDHERLCSHSFWPDEYNTGSFFMGRDLIELLRKLQELNHDLGCRAFILPSLLAAAVDGDWLQIQGAIIEAAQAQGADLPLMATIALSAEVVKDEDQIATLLETAETWKVAGFYIVCEHPNGQYLVSEPNWVANVIDLAAGLRLLGSKVVLGLRLPRKVTDSNKIDWFITEQYGSQRHILEALQSAEQSLWSGRFFPASIQSTSETADNDHGDSYAQFFLPAIVSGATSGCNLSSNVHSQVENINSQGISGISRPSNASNITRQAITVSIHTARAILSAV